MQAYSNPDRENEPTALPDVEVFYVGKSDFLNAEKDSWQYDALWDYAADNEATPRDVCAVALSGYYYWFCFPGCLPDSDPSGPFKTEVEALADAQSNYE